jgi:hypothetical protein
MLLYDVDYEAFKKYLGRMHLKASESSMNTTAAPRMRPHSQSIGAW